MSIYGDFWRSSLILSQRIRDEFLMRMNG
jgi:hypothetical protein